MSDVSTPQETILEYPKSSGNGSSTEYSYLVEARWNCNGESQVVNGEALGPKWVTLNFSRDFGNDVRIDLPTRKNPDGFSFAAAQALRWWFVAFSEAGANWCLETRIVRYRRETIHTTTAEAATEPMDSREAGGSKWICGTK